MIRFFSVLLTVFVFVGLIKSFNVFASELSDKSVNYCHLDRNSDKIINIKDFIMFKLEFDKMRQNLLSNYQSNFGKICEEKDESCLILDKNNDNIININDFNIARRELSERQSKDLINLQEHFGLMC